MKRHGHHATYLCHKVGLHFICIKIYMYFEKNKFAKMYFNLSMMEDEH